MYVIMGMSENDTKRIGLSCGTRQLEIDVLTFTSAEVGFIMSWVSLYA